MNWLALLARLSVLLVAVSVLGSLYTVAVGALGSVPMLVVAVLTALLVVGLSVYGVRAADVTATPYW